MWLKLLATWLLIALTPLPAEREERPSGRVQLVASEAGSTDLYPSSRWYKAVVNNQGTNSIHLSAFQMPGGYSGDGRFFACSLQLWDNKGQNWVTLHSQLFSNRANTPRTVRVEIRPGQQLEVCGGLYPNQNGRAGACARFALSREIGQRPIFFSNPFRIVGQKDKSQLREPCK